MARVAVITFHSQGFLSKEALGIGKKNIYINIGNIQPNIYRLKQNTAFDHKLLEFSGVRFVSTLCVPDMVILLFGLVGSMKFKLNPTKLSCVNTLCSRCGHDNSVKFCFEGKIQLEQKLDPANHDLKPHFQSACLLINLGPHTLVFNRLEV